MAHLNRGLIVSCQAVKGEPLYGLGIMKYMARAAVRGGAVGIRANYVSDILDIRSEVDVPIIAIIKAEYPDSEVYITPTKKEVDDLIECGAKVIALDATLRNAPAESRSKSSSSISAKRRPTSRSWRIAATSMRRRTP